MGKITEEIKNFVSGRLAYIATTSPEGLPNIGPKGSFRIIDDEHIGWNESTGKQHFENLKKNPNVAVAVADRENRTGYRFTGKAQIISEGALYESAKAEFKKLGYPIPVAVVRVPVDGIYDLVRGTKIA